jgi:hypothetical protein
MDMAMKHMVPFWGGHKDRRSIVNQVLASPLANLSLSIQGKLDAKGTESVQCQAELAQQHKAGTM